MLTRSETMSSQQERKNDNHMKTTTQLLATIAICHLITSYSIAQNSSTSDSASLPVTLAAENEPASSALEFRRMAMESSDSREKGACFWAAAYEYWKADRPDLADKILDRSEDVLPDPFLPRTLLRGELAITSDKFTEADFYLEGLIKSDTPADYKNYAARRLAVTQLLRYDTDAARAAILSAPQPSANGLKALEEYRSGRDKSPTIGGLLGIIPGLGYFYSGEYANGVRSIILNGLFIWGMSGTAKNEQWGAFGVITFCEITWYTGSIYGGIDAATRSNLDRLNRCEEGIMDNAAFEPEWKSIPIINLNFTF